MKIDFTNILDTVFVNNEEIVTAEVIPGISVHHIALKEINLEARRKKIPKRKVYIRDRADKDKVLKDLINFQAPYFLTPRENPSKTDMTWLKKQSRPPWMNASHQSLLQADILCLGSEENREGCAEQNNEVITKPKESVTRNIGATTLRFPTSGKGTLSMPETSISMTIRVKLSRKTLRGSGLSKRNQTWRCWNTRPESEQHRLVSDSKQKAEAFKQQFASVFIVQGKNKRSLT